MKSNKCPRCNTYIFGTHCHKCKEDINDMLENKSSEDFMNMFRNIFEGDNNGQ